MLSEKLKEVFEHEGVVTIIAQGKDFPHAVNTWNSYVSLCNNCLIVPVGGMNTMEKILENDNRVLVTAGAKEVNGLHGQGTGFLIKGNAAILFQGKEYEEIAKRFVWARAAMKIDISDLNQTT
ncbi:FMN-binding protein [Sulfurimonas sp. HSL-1716]|uniref:FMN-binding protein n=1 Tax=Hydrocurvibacter sulfurireducens TaxID=3131937 RepID=UPI0031F8AE52